MALSFDHAGKLIGVPQADAAPILMQTLINAIRTEEASERGITYDAIASAAGKDDLGGGVSTGITVNLLSTWKLNFEAGAYQATVTGGNLSDALSRINNTGDPQVLVLSSSAGTVVAIGSGVTAQDKTDIANAVGARIVEAGKSQDEMTRIIAASSAGTSNKVGNQVTFKGIDGVTDRIVGTYDDDRNRTSATYDGS